ncbi:MAG: recombinase family protein [Oscillospiraceae bacterium]|nr:recombinase family protein [Oscillospiraceae bacterium]
MKEIVVGYARVSTKDKEQLQSFEHQQTYFRREFGEHEQYELRGIYADEGKTGTKLSRPAFDQMIWDAGIDKSRLDGDLYLIVGKPKFNRILVKNTSRFARNVSVDMLIKTLAKNGVYVDFIDTGLSTEKAGDAIALGVLQLIDQEESKDKSRKVTFGMIEGAKKGNILKTGRIYGYKYYPRPENRLEIIEEEADVVRWIFEMYNDGIGAYRIRNILMQEQIFNRQGKPFHEATIRSMLANETYCGKAARLKWDTGVVFEKHSSRKMRPKEEQIIFETDKIPAIISVEDFETAQQLRESKIQHKIQKGMNRGKTDYSDKVFCGCCGTQYSVTCTAQRKTGSKRYYACVQKRKMAFDDNSNRIFLCENPNISEWALDAELTSENYNYLRYDNLVGAIAFLEQVRETAEYRLENTDTTEIETLQTELATKEQRIAELLQLLTDGVVDRAYIEKAAAPIQAEVTALKERLP